VLATLEAAGLDSLPIDASASSVANGSGDGSVIVWPPGTKVSGEGENLRIASEARTVRLGEDVQRGRGFGQDFLDIREKLPAECGGADLIQVGLSS
jgi:hypothetical protein